MGNTGTQDQAAAGGIVVRHFPITFATPGLLAGATVYVPTVNDVLLDAWFQVNTVWNGTTPLLDVGTFNGIATGLFHQGLGAVNLALADTANAGAGLLGQGASSLVEMAGGNGGDRSGAPGLFTAANPLKVCVSTTGATTGAATGATQGAGVLYIVTGTPS